MTATRARLIEGKVSFCERVIVCAHRPPYYYDQLIFINNPLLIIAVECAV